MQLTLAHLTQTTSTGRLCNSSVSQAWKSRGREMMNPRTEKLVRRTTMVATVTASYFLLTADYGPEPNALDPVKDAIRSAQSSVKSLMFGSRKQQEGRESDEPKKHM